VSVLLYLSTIVSILGSTGSSGGGLSVRYATAGRAFDPPSAVLPFVLASVTQRCCLEQRGNTAATEDGTEHKESKELLFGRDAFARAGASGETRSSEGQRQSIRQTIDFIQSKAGDFGNFSRTFTPTDGEAATQFPTTVTRTLSIEVVDGELRTREHTQRVIDRSESQYDAKRITIVDDFTSSGQLRDLRAVIEIEGGDLDTCSLVYECTLGNCIKDHDTRNTHFSEGVKRDLLSTQGEQAARNTLLLNGGDSCHRMKTALEHLIRLSGGTMTKEPF